MQPFLVARMDGTPQAGFAPGAIGAKTDVPVTLDFDHARVIGRADVTVDGDELRATITTRNPLTVAGLYPAVGGHVLKARVQDGVRVIEEFDLVTVGLCSQPNADPTIPPL